MKKNLISIMLSIITLFGIAGQAAAAPVVLAGSSYSAYIEGDVSDDAFSAVGLFDGAATTYSRAGLNLSLTESDIDLGGGMNRITIDLAANGDLFPNLGEAAILGMGVDGDGLDLLTLVSLDQALIRLFDANGTLLFESGNLASGVGMGNPWDGYFPAPGSAFGIDAAGGIGVSRVVFEFQVSALPAAIPEPGGMLLAATALFALCAIRRRRLGR